MRKLIFILSVLSFILFFTAETVVAAHRVYKCPSSQAYQQHLVSGTTLKLCPGTEKQCHHKVWMSSYLKKYGGYPPKEKWKVTSVRGYKHRQCRYSVAVTKKDKSIQTLPGYMLIKVGGLTDCKYLKGHHNHFKCKLKRKTT